MSRIRGYPSVLQMELGPDAIPTSVYTNLIDTVHDRLPALHRYLRLRKKLLHLDELQMWDLYVPMIPNVERQIPFDEGKSLVLDSVEPLGQDVSGVIRRGFDERWVDVLENEGKTSGAYSDGSYLTPPYMLLKLQRQTGQRLYSGARMGATVCIRIWRANLSPTFTRVTPSSSPKSPRLYWKRCSATRC